MRNSTIEWTDHTFNPWSGCAKVSPACAHCYAAALPPSMRRGAEWGPAAPRVPASDAYWQRPLAWDRAAQRAGKPARVFCASVADVFEDRPELDPLRERLWDLIGQTPDLRWLLLTKRPEVMARYADRFVAHPNAWAGVTVEDQQRADERIPWLLQVPARVRFLSCEPLLGPLDLRRTERAASDAIDREWRDGRRGHPLVSILGDDECCAPSVHWIIAGGESGHRARPSHPDWFRSLRDQAVAAEVPFFFKQWGEWLPGQQYQREGATPAAGWFEKRHEWPDGAISWHYGKHATGRLLDGHTHDAFPPLGQVGRIDA